MHDKGSRDDISRAAARLVNGAVLTNFAPDGPHTVTEVRWVGEDSAVVKATDPYGLPVERMLLAADIATLTMEDSAAVRLDGDPDLFRLAIEAVRIAHAHQLDPLMAVGSANIEPLPHQVQAVYEHMLERRPLRFLLADDPGAGKTVMAGLYIKEALARGLARRVLVAAPGSLVEQWQDELQLKFGLSFEVFDRSMVDRSGAFPDVPLLIVRVDQFARDELLLDDLADARYDLAIVDEAHKLTARYWGGRVEKSKRYQLGEVLRDHVNHLLLMTATPHNGKEDEFQLFLRLLGAKDGSAAPEGEDEESTRLEAMDLMRRLVKEQLKHADGQPLFPPRVATTVNYELSPLEQELYEQVSEYVRHEMNKVTGEDTKRTVGFALLVLQRRLASSPAAILASLRRRRGRLQEQADNARARQDLYDQLASRAWTGGVPNDEDEMLRAEIERLEDDLSETATTARTVAELDAEVIILGDLVEAAERVMAADVDRKWEALAQLLRSPEMFDESGHRRKIIVFTEHRDTLAYLEERVERLLDGDVRLETIHGGTSRGDRREAQRRFVEDRDCSILLATDAAGEGVNLQSAHLMVNYDLPWNPNRLEQRFGRIHRIGQRHVCHLWNLVAADTREGQVFITLLGKLEAQREALGDQVFDVLGSVLTGRDLQGLLTEALRGGGGAHAEQVVEEKVGRDLEVEVARRAAAISDLTDEDLVRLRSMLADSRVRSLQGRVIEDFVTEAMHRLGGDLNVSEGRCAVGYVPEDVRSWAHEQGTSVERRYAQLAFHRSAIEVRGRPAAELLGPGHPLLDGLVATVLERSGEHLRRGVVLADDRSADPAVLATFTVGSGVDASVVTVRASLSGVEVADPAGYTSLPTHPTGDSDSDRAGELLEIARTEVGSAADAELIAWAYIVPTGTVGDVAERERRIELAAQSLGGQPRRARPFEGWDLEVETVDGKVFARVAASTERRNERLARVNAGEAYRCME